MNYELRYISFGAREPLADNLRCAVHRQHVCIVMLGYGWLVVPGSATVDKLGFDA